MPASRPEAPILGRPRAAETILYGGAAVGVLDGLAASVNAGLRGTSPARVFQYVASGLLGPASFEGGTATVLLGVLLHFAVAFGAAAVYWLASLRLPALVRRPLLCGALYGVAVYFVMGRVVTPLSAARTLPFSLTSMLTGILIHVLFVGLPVALVARWSAGKNRR